MKSILDKCVQAPKLRNDEEILDSITFKRDYHDWSEIIGTNNVLILTNKRLIMKPKKGKRSPSELQVDLELNLADINKIRTSGFYTVLLEIETNTITHSIEFLSDIKNIVKQIVNIENLQRTSWGGIFKKEWSRDEG